MERFNFLRFFALAFISLLLSCNKNDPTTITLLVPEVEEGPKDRWEYTSVMMKDSVGNTYSMAATHDNRLQIRIKNEDGEPIFSAYCTEIDSTEIPDTISSFLGMSLTSANPYISANDVTVALRLNKGIDAAENSDVHLIMNINLETGEFHTKKYKVENGEGWTFIHDSYSIVQWYQNTILVREVSYSDMMNSYMGLGSRGTQLVCYERDFTVRYVKDINVNYASYPTSRAIFIPVSTTEAVSFVNNLGLITRFAIVVSQADEWLGVKPEVWQIDLKATNNLSQTDVVKIIDYDIRGNSVFATYEVYDSSGNLIMTNDGEWDVRTAFPLKRFNP